jgi:hypothetical protein
VAIEVVMVVEAADKSTFQAMDRMAFKQRVDGVMITTVGVGLVDLISNTTVCETV